jgi:N-methylhydantoinase A/oxoprolinase/acetone carboxylase beta subunit
MISPPAAGLKSVRVAVDIGGTFTDIVLMSDDGVLHESKALEHDPEKWMFNAAHRAQAASSQRECRDK